MKLLAFLVTSLFCILPQAQVLEKTLGFVGERALLLSETYELKKRIQLKLEPDTSLFLLFPKTKLLKNSHLRVQFLAYRQALLKQAKRLGLEVSEQEASRLFKKIPGSRAQKLMKLKRQGWNLTRFNKYLTESLQAEQALIKSVSSKILISENDIQGYFFSKNRKNLYSSFQYEVLSLILPRSRAGQGEDIKKFLERASVPAAVKKFQLKKQVSKFKTGDMNPSMKKAVERLSVSETSHPVRVGNNTYIFKLLWKRPLLTGKLISLKSKIEKRLFKKEMRQELKKWFQNKISHFSIRISSL